ncbi:MAG TPA: hypothetical protein VJQ57_13985 [Acidimicrobiia bacterium]|nr:hypothetical protein [Acidimicrobiia bacterium]
MDEFEVTADDEGTIRVSIDEEEQKVSLLFAAEGENGPIEVEVGLTPELCRDLAFTLTRASYILEGDDTL